jgi:hypothetical protein
MFYVALSLWLNCRARGSTLHRVCGKVAGVVPLSMKTAILLLSLALGTGLPACAADTNPPEWIYRPKGNYAGHTDRPLRYFPDGTDFVVTNGPEFFNRPLYCANSGFRIDGGDKPEFSLYLPGRGGNLRLGLKTAAGVKWLNDADQIIARYRPGSLLYQIRDPLLETGKLTVVVLPLADAKGLVARAELHETGAPVELIFAFGGANGMKGRRGGDIGCESEPVGKFFQLKPEQCRSNEFALASNTFVLRSKPATIAGVASAGAKLAVGDATEWPDAAGLVKLGRERRSPDRHLSDTTDPGAGQEPGAPFPVLVGEIALCSNQPVYLALQPSGNNAQAIVTDDLPKLFSAAETHRRAIAGRVVVDTPDPFINAAVPALCVAADAIWDTQQQSFMHGAVAWRVRLLGWRGPYAGDALGWHDRTAAHFAGYARQQNTNAVPDKIPPADETVNLARNEAALHSNGDLTKSHYDMNLVGVDAFFRHLLWTGDRDYARQMWPVIERHLAWERRLFRREFGPDKLPLYEAYAAIWASDNLNYNGGGVAHASAYNYWHNRMAARVAKLIGKDPMSYEKEADLILRGMRKYLWLPAEGQFAEFKDYLGLQLVHPNAGLWTFYHTLDSEVPTPAEAGQMARWVEDNIARIPVDISVNQTSNIQHRTPNIQHPGFHTLPTTGWMPYQWSLNNVVMAEAAHTSLAYWQANRPDAAFALFKGCLLDSMYLGLCPGNLGMTSGFDMARGEAQRDFGDAIGITARALVEGLFGVRPDALAGELKIVPGFPPDWNHASIRHPDFNFEFRREGLKETYIIESKFPSPLSPALVIPGMPDEISKVTVNGARVKWFAREDFYGEPRVGIQSLLAQHQEIVVVRNHKPRFDASAISDIAEQKIPATPGNNPLNWNQPFPAGTKLETVDLAFVFNDRDTRIFRNDYRSPRSPFCSLALPKQGLGGWCDYQMAPDIDDAGLRAVAAKAGGKLVMPNGVPFQIPTNAEARNIAFTSQWDNYPREVTVPLSGKASHVFLLMAGSTGPLQSRFDNGEVLVTYTDGATERLTLRNPDNWWPIEQDYFMDDYAFRRLGPIPPRVDLQTGKVRLLDANEFKSRGGKIPGGAATVLDLPLEPGKELKSLTVRALANEVVIGLMAVTLERGPE